MHACVRIPRKNSGISEPFFSKFRHPFLRIPAPLSQNFGTAPTEFRLFSFQKFVAFFSLGAPRSAMWGTHDSAPGKGTGRPKPASENLEIFVTLFSGFRHPLLRIPAPFAFGAGFGCVLDHFRSNFRPKSDQFCFKSH